MKHIFPTSEIAHKWAHQTQDYASNPQHNLYFKGATLYSYRDSAPIGCIYGKRKKTLVLLSSERFSVTTSGHQSAAARAVSHLASVSVPDLGHAACCPKDMHACNLKHFEDIAADMLAKAQHAMQVRTVEWRSREAQQAIADWIVYAAFFGIRRKVPDQHSVVWQLALNRVSRIESPDPVRDAAKYRAKQKREVGKQVLFDHIRAEEIALNAKNEVKWRAGESTYTKHSKSYYALSYNKRRELGMLPATGTWLRVKGDQVETSQGASIPIAHCPRLWKLIQDIRAGIRPPYQHNGHTEHVGEFQVDSIAADGTLKAGCHVIEYPELEALAVTLGLHHIDNFYVMEADDPAQQLPEKLCLDGSIIIE